MCALWLEIIGIIAEDEEGNKMEKYMREKDAMEEIERTYKDFVLTDADVEIIHNIMEGNKSQYDRCVKILIYGTIRHVDRVKLPHLLPHFMRGSSPINNTRKQF